MKEMYNNYKKELKKKNNILIVIMVIFILGLIFGSLYITILENDEKTLVLNQVSSYFNNTIKLNFESKIEIFKNSLISNFLYLITMWFLGISAIGLPIIFIMVFFKSFTLGFSISGIFAKYGLKGFLLTIPYITISPLCLSIFTLILSLSSTIISIKILKNAFTKQTINFKAFMGRYFFILLIGILLSIFCALFDAFVTPSFTKLFTNLIK